MEVWRFLSVSPFHKYDFAQCMHFFIIAVFIMEHYHSFYHSHFYDPYDPPPGAVENFQATTSILDRFLHIYTSLFTT